MLYNNGSSTEVEIMITNSNLPVFVRLVSTVGPYILPVITEREGETFENVLNVSARQQYQRIGTDPPYRRIESGLMIINDPVIGSTLAIATDVTM